MKNIIVGTRTIGPHEPCFVIAEVGLNHNGDLDLARQLIDAAAAAGADAVKFQTYRTEDFLSNDSLTYEYVVNGTTVVESQFTMFKRCELPSEALAHLATYCENAGVVFFGTPTSAAGIRDLVAAGAKLLKNGSDLLPHLPLIRAMAETGLPTLLSTGMATFEEVQLAVQAYRKAGGDNLLLLHCTSAYPTLDHDVHLRKIPTLAEAFECLVGFSDHTESTIAALGARALGACAIEKHFTLSHEMTGPDHRLSADPGQMRTLVESLRQLEANLGADAVGPTAAEAIARTKHRVATVAARDLAAGTELSQSDIAFHRPATGLSPHAIEAFMGRALKRSVDRNRPITAEDFC